MFPFLSIPILTLFYNYFVLPHTRDPILNSVSLCPPQYITSIRSVFHFQHLSYSFPLILSMLILFLTIILFSHSSFRSLNLLHPAEISFVISILCHYFAMSPFPDFLFELTPPSVMLAIGPVIAKPLCWTFPYPFIKEVLIHQQLSSIHRLRQLSTVLHDLLRARVPSSYGLLYLSFFRHTS